MDSTNKDELLREKLRLLEADKKHRLNLPHKYGWKNYPWFNEFFDTNNRTALLCAANQISKSSSQIRKVIALATEKEYWPKYFRQRPKLFWYLYPTATIATTEFRTKWVTDFLPRGEYKSHPDFGWREEFRNRGDIFAIHFNTGVSIYFKTYEQDATALQASSVDYVACFSGDTLVDTESGKKRIDQVIVGEKVWTKEGDLRRVYGVKKKKAFVIRRFFSDGTYIDATPDHLFWVDSKWKRFDELTDSDVLYSNSAWEKPEEKKVLNLTGECISDTQIRKIEGITISSGKNMLEGLVVRTKKQRHSSFIEKFGSFFTEKFQTAQSFITSMRTYLITVSRIFHSSLEQSTTYITRLMNGRQADLVFTDNGYVSFAGKNFKQEQLRKQPEDSVVRSAEKNQEIDVYCLQVESNNNFFANGVCVKNCDEELPEDLWDEVNFRRNATDGLFSMVFTATLGQEFWRKAIEPKESEKEVMPDAWKMQVSMFDCRYYDDGTPSHWTTERIHRTIGMCKSEAEVQRRVYGKFIKDSGLKYQSFTRSINVVDAYDIPPDWVHYAGVDLGAGGEDNHPSAITLIAVAPNYQRSCVYKSWRGDQEQTTMTDVANKYLELKGYQQVAAAFYDYASKEFKIVTDRMGMSFLPADKGRETGEQVMNALFKNKMLDIFNIPENEPLISEIMTLAIGVDKRKAKDDSVDSCRYAVTRIPWDWSYAERKISLNAVVEKKKLTPVEIASVDRERDRARMVANKFQEEIDLGIDREIQEWAEYLDKSF